MEQTDNLHRENMSILRHLADLNYRCQKAHVINFRGVTLEWDSNLGDYITSCQDKQMPGVKLHIKQRRGNIKNK